MSEIKIEVNGKQYSGFTSAVASKSVSGMAGKFTFTTTVKANTSGIIQNDLKAQDEVKIYIGDDLFLTGKIENLNITSDSTTHTISVSGRDKLGDLIDSSVIPIEYKQRNFVRLLKNVLKDNGYSDIKIIDNVGNISPIQLEDDEKIYPEKGETIAQFIDRYAEKLAVLIYSDEEGNLTINREGSDIANGGLLRKFGDANNNILSSSIDIDITERYRHLEVYSQGNNDTFGENSIDQRVSETDSEIIFPRRKIIPQNTATKNLSLSASAKWNIALRRAKGARYQCQVQDFYTARDKGFLWQLNTLVSLNDDVCQVNGQFLIESVTFSKTNQGTLTNISVVNRGSFSLDFATLKSGDFAEDLIKTS